MFRDNILAILRSSRMIWTKLRYVARLCKTKTLLLSRREGGKSSPQADLLADISEPCEASKDAWEAFSEYYWAQNDEIVVSEASPVSNADLFPKCWEKLITTVPVFMQDCCAMHASEVHEFNWVIFDIISDAIQFKLMITILIKLWSSALKQNHTAIRLCFIIPPYTSPSFNQILSPNKYLLQTDPHPKTIPIKKNSTPNKSLPLNNSPVKQISRLQQIPSPNKSTPLNW